jgi:hypothetical protein
VTQLGAIPLSASSLIAFSVLREMRQAHAVQNMRGLGELDVLISAYADSSGGQGRAGRIIKTVSLSTLLSSRILHWID